MKWSLDVPLSRPTRVGDLIARGFVGGMFVAFAYNILLDFAHTGRTTGLLLLASESLVAVFTVIRRQAIEVAHELAHLAMP